MSGLNIELPDEAFTALRCSREEMAREMRRAAAIYWYSRGIVSQERAAMIAGMDRTDFLLALASEKVDAFAVDVEDLRREVERA